MTRHGMSLHRVEAAPLRPSDTLVLTVSGTVRPEPGTEASTRQHRRRASITVPAGRSDGSTDHGFASLDCPRRLRALARPAKSP